jgi:hypothetical protein
MGSLAVIATLYGQRAIDNLPRLLDAWAAQTRQPDEVWWMTEGISPEIMAGLPAGEVVSLPTPRNADGTYAVIPYSWKINYALGRTTRDYVTYLTDDSWPGPEKYERMVRALDENPTWGAVYCTQEFEPGVNRVANEEVGDAHCRVDHTQVMHRLTPDRWPIDIGDIQLGDAIFWRRLHASLGPFYPVGPEPLDYVRQTRDGISGGQRA